MSRVEDSTATLVSVQSERSIWVKGINGELQRFDDIKRFWVYHRDTQNDISEVWASAGENGTEIFRGTKAEAEALQAELDSMLKPYDLTDPFDRAELMKEIGYDNRS